jgi:hypothetical protein
MRKLEFLVCWRPSEATWIVLLDAEVYGMYLSREQALLDAVDAAGDAQQAGDDARVWDEGRAHTLSYAPAGP